jgi:precorrin-2 dehydrogenase/sirohydrochlorin ferrochelatase
MLDIRHKVAIVIGGNQLAAEKVAGLVACGAQVRVLSPTFCYTLLLLAQQHTITLCHKSYQKGDLAGAFIVIVATSDPQLAEAVASEAQEHGQPINVVDMPRHCSFILPSILRRGQLTIAVSTEGASPGLAKRIRQQLAKLFSPAYEPYLRLASAARTRLRANNVSYKLRDDFFGDYFASEVLARLEVGDITTAAAVTQALLQPYGVETKASALEKEAYNNETEEWSGLSGWGGAG